MRALRVFEVAGVRVGLAPHSVRACSREWLEELAADAIAHEWPAYLAYRPDDHLFFNAYTYEQVETFVKANPRRWMANPYAGDANAVLGKPFDLGELIVLVDELTGKAR